MLNFMSADKLRAQSGMKFDLPVAEILRVAHEHGATSVRVFGSRARGDSTPDSDLDLLVRLDPKRSLLELIAFNRTSKTCSVAK